MAEPKQGLLTLLAYLGAMAFCLAFWWFLPQITIWLWKAVVR